MTPDRRGPDRPSDAEYEAHLREIRADLGIAEGPTALQLLAAEIAASLAPRPVVLELPPRERIGMPA